MAAPHGWLAWLGPWLTGLGVTVAIMVGADLLLDPEEWWAGLIVLGGISLWVAWDSTRIGIRNYRTQLANDPVMLLFLCFMFWIPVFPWYLIVRQGIRRGLVPLRRRATTR